MHGQLGALLLTAYIKFLFYKIFDKNGKMFWQSLTTHPNPVC